MECSHTSDSFKIIEQVIKEDEYRLPDWDDWGDYIMNGLRLKALGFVVVLPFFMLMGLAYLFIFSPLIMRVFTAPTYGRDVAEPMFFTWMLGWTGAMLTVGVSILLIVRLGIFFPAAMSRLIAEHRFSAAFRIKEWWPIFKANIWGYVIAYILLLGTLYMTMFAVQLFYLTILLCCLIPFVFGGDLHRCFHGGHVRPDLPRRSPEERDGHKQREKRGEEKKVNQPDNNSLLWKSRTYIHLSNYITIKLPNFLTIPLPNYPTIKPSRPNHRLNSCPARAWFHLI